MNRKYKVKSTSRIYEFPERSPWDSGFSVFKRRIEEQLQLSGFSDGLVEDSDLLSYYRMGESETYVLSALGCAVGV